MIPKRKTRLRAALAIAACLAAAGPSAGQAKRAPVSPAEGDKCAVCGMFVAKYKDFLAEILFKDGGTAFFDGPKDMFAYFFNPAEFSPGRTRDGIEAIYVTEYYGLGWVDARSAWFVIGSDVFGPMGHELVPFKTRAEAEQFLKDHKGRAILAFKDVTPETLKEIG